MMEGISKTNRKLDMPEDSQKRWRFASMEKQGEETETLDALSKYTERGFYSRDLAVDATVPFVIEVSGATGGDIEQPVYKSPLDFPSLFIDLRKFASFREVLAVRHKSVKYELRNIRTDMPMFTSATNSVPVALQDVKIKFMDVNKLPMWNSPVLPFGKEADYSAWINLMTTINQRNRKIPPTHSLNFSRRLVWKSWSSQNKLLNCSSTI